MEELQNEMDDDILEFAKRMDARWTEPIESLKTVKQQKLVKSTDEAESDSTQEVLMHGETKEKSIYLVLTTPSVGY